MCASCLGQNCCNNAPTVRDDKDKDDLYNDSTKINKGVLPQPADYVQTVYLERLKC